VISRRYCWSGDQQRRKKFYEMRALMILIFLRIFVNDRQKSIVGQATNKGIFKKIQLAQNFMKRALMILIFLRTFVSG
jgi:hypothetical protein